MRTVHRIAPGIPPLDCSTAGLPKRIYDNNVLTLADFMTERLSVHDRAWKPGTEGHPQQL